MDLSQIKALADMKLVIISRILPICQLMNFQKNGNFHFSCLWNRLEISWLDLKLNLVSHLNLASIRCDTLKAKFFLHFC